MSDSVGLLLRRATFGPTSAELAGATSAGYAATLSNLMNHKGRDAGADSSPPPDLGRDPFDNLPDPTTEQRYQAEAIRVRQTNALLRWWLDRMTVAEHQAYEKLLFFWHGHWATSIRKVGSPQFMLAQHEKIRAAPDFRAMARKLVVDPALVYWLDGEANTRSAPNENLARELMELFTLGRGNYTELDVHAAARALTGWKTDLGVPQSAVLVPADHDPTAKTILGRTAPFDAFTLVDLLVRQPACPRFIASRLWFRYGSSDDPVPASTLRAMVAAFPVGTDMLRALFADEQFRSNQFRMVKQPVEWLVGALRQLGIRPANLSDSVLGQLEHGLDSLGQIPFAPPSVGGWPSGASWLTSAAAQVRLSMAGTLARLAGSAPSSVEDLARVLAVDTWTNRTYEVLKRAPDTRSLLTLGLVSPEYLVT